MTTDEWRVSLLRRVDTVEQDLKTFDSRLLGIELKNAADEVHQINVNNRLASIEDTLKWLVKLVIGALILGVVGYVVDGGLSLTP